MRKYICPKTQKLVHLKTCMALCDRPCKDLNQHYREKTTGNRGFRCPKCGNKTIIYWVAEPSIYSVEIPRIEYQDEFDMPGAVCYKCDHPVA